MLLWFRLLTVSATHVGLSGHSNVIESTLDRYNVQPSSVPFTVTLLFSFRCNVAAHFMHRDAHWCKMSWFSVKAVIYCPFWSNGILNTGNSSIMAWEIVTTTALGSGHLLCEWVVSRKVIVWSKLKTRRSSQRNAEIRFKGTAYSYKALMSLKCSWAKM